MLLVKTKLESSKTHGVGLFAAENISQGTRVWQFSPGLDREITENDFGQLHKKEQEVILFYGYHSKKTGRYHLSFDDVRFINHSTDGNVTSDTLVEDVQYPLIAKRDIREGEEILHDYYEIDKEHAM